MEHLKKYIREVPNFPKPGINFFDITTLFQDPVGFNMALDAMEIYVRSKKPNKIVAVEARGFVFGAAMADRLDLGLIPARKAGKLPYKTITEEYDLEYGTDKIQIHSDSIVSGDRVVIVDDLIATGGTLAATCRLVEKLGGEVVGISTVIGLVFLPYQDKLSRYDVNFLISYDSE
jgi:adenine phosphoribosyltransferase